MPTYIENINNHGVINIQNPEHKTPTQLTSKLGKDTIVGRAKELEKAEEIFEFCVKNFNNKEATLHHLLGSVYVLKDEYKNALNQFKKALALEPNNEKYQKKITSIKKIIDYDKGFLNNCLGNN